MSAETLSAPLKIYNAELIHFAIKHGLVERWALEAQ